MGVDEENPDPPLFLDKIKEELKKEEEKDPPLILDKIKEQIKNAKGIPDSQKPKEDVKGEVEKNFETKLVNQLRQTIYDGTKRKGTRAKGAGRGNGDPSEKEEMAENNAAKYRKK